MTCWLVHAIYSLPEWQAVKLTFFAPGQHTVEPLLLDIGMITKNFTLSNAYKYKKWNKIFTLD